MPGGPDELAREQLALRARLAQLDTELAAVVLAAKVIAEPSWTPPKALPRLQKRVTTLAWGKVGLSCLELLRKHN